MDHFITVYLVAGYISIWLSVLRYVATLEYLIAEQAILREQACFFSKNVKGAGCIKRAGWNYFIKD